MNLRLFKGFFIVLAGLFVFITLLSLFIPSKLMVTRAEVFDQISNLQQWKRWQPVFMNDSASITFYTGADGVSDSCAWVSKGKKNTMHFTQMAGHSVSAVLKREGENEVLNTISVLPLADSNQVQAEWNVLIKLKWYPWEKFYGIFIEKITGEGYDAALKSLKSYVEEN
jgi:hypothetical protein